METVTLWKDILGRIVPYAPEAHIAGGAVRDYLLGRETKDIDVFLPDNAPIGAIEEALRDLYTGCQVNSCREYTDWNSVVSQTGDLTPTQDGIPPLNLISLWERLTPRQNMERFDFGLCKVAFDLEEGLTTDSTFWADVSRRNFTVTRVENFSQLHRTMERYKRISPRYPGWKLVLPQEAVDLLLRSKDFV